MSKTNPTPEQIEKMAEEYATKIFSDENCSDEGDRLVARVSFKAGAHAMQSLMDAQGEIEKLKAENAELHQMHRIVLENYTAERAATVVGNE